MTVLWIVLAINAAVLAYGLGMWRLEASRPRPDVRFDADEVARLKLKSEREGNARGWREAKP